MPRFASKKFVIAFLAIIVVVAGGYFIWDRYFSAAGKARRFLTEQVDTYQRQEKAYIEAMTADTYGGKTPQETLDLFVVALRKGDVELASKYFLLDEYISREKWVAFLNDVKSKKLLDQMADDIAKFAKPLPLTTPDENVFSFGLFDDNGAVAIYIDMRLNKYSDLWKIESI